MKIMWISCRHEKGFWTCCGAYDIMEHDTRMESLVFMFYDDDTARSRVAVTMSLFGMYEFKMLCTCTTMCNTTFTAEKDTLLFGDRW